MIQIKKVLSLFINICMLLMVSFSINSFAAAKKPLPADQAFAFSVSMNQANQKTNQIIAEWRIAPGYHLYRERLNIELIPNRNAKIFYPKPELKKDFAGIEYESYSGHLIIPIQLQAGTQTLQFRVAFQGCSESGFCYPPIHKNLQLNFSDQSVTDVIQDKSIKKTNISLNHLLTDQNSIQSLLMGKQLSVLLLLFVGLGLLLAFTPCVLPMVPILTSIIVGQKQTVSTKKAFLLSLSYVLGSAMTYALAGLMAVILGNSLQALLQKPFVILMVSGLFVLLSLSLFGIYHLQLPSRIQNRIAMLSNQQKSGHYIGVFIMGMISTLIVSPCVTAPLVGVLMYISQTGDKLLGMSALFAMGIGMGLPLLLIGTSAGKWLPKSGPWMEAVKKLFGLLMLGMAVWLASRILEEHVTYILCGLLLFGVAGFFSIYLARVIGFKVLNRTLGLITGFLGLFVILNGTGISSFNQNKYVKNGMNPFVIVHDISELNKELALARAEKKPVILDFFATWCESCLLMDKNVFSMPGVKQALNKYVLLRADLSANSLSDEELLKHFDVIAPPTVLFFDANGRELNRQRVVGEINAKEFLTRLDTLFTKSCEQQANC